MFTFGATPVKFIGLLLLFAWCTAWCLVDLSGRQDARQRISNLAHLAMAVVMLLMVAGPTWAAMTSIVPTPVLAGFFGLATVWFGWLAVEAFRAADRSGGLHFAGHTAMFAAMTWHLTAMALMAAGAKAAMAAGMGMGQWMMAAGRPGGMLWIIALIGLVLMAYLLVAALRSAWFVVRPPEVVPACHDCHPEAQDSTARRRLTALSDFAMNFGMFWMSTGLMLPILPFFAVLAF